MALGVSAAMAMAMAMAPPAAAGEIRLRDRAGEWGLDFRHHDGGSGRRYLPETMGSGVVVFDYDADGDADVFLLDGGPLPGSPAVPFRSRLYRNDGGRFVDVTERSEIEPGGFGAGGAAADVDGDADLDLYLTALGANSLWLNRGDGSFRRADPETGAGDELWGASAAFADPDSDGDLDLYVANYVDFAPADRTPCRQQDVEVYCHPGQYDGLPDRFFRNVGDGDGDRDGRFEEVSVAAGLAVDARAGLGVAFADFDDDGHTDLYVANDAEANFLFHNRGDGTFEETALLAGTAYGDTGRPEAGMGVAVGDVDGDGLADVFVTNFELETNVLYRNAGGLLFTDVRFAANVAEASILSLAFGVEMADLDHDGDLDLVIANGHILDNAASFHERSRYAQPDQVFENLGGGRFREVRDFGAGPDRVGRGLATGDLDGDGDLDVVVNNVDEEVTAYENLGAKGGWLVVDLRAATGNRHGIGARLAVLASPSEGRAAQVREIRAGSSYLSQSDGPAHFGIGAASDVRLEVRWPGGARQRLSSVPADRRLRLERSPAGTR